MKETKIECVTTMTHLRVYIQGLLHLSIRLNDIEGIQSWIVSDKNYRIVYYMRGREIVSEYEKRSNWETVLSGLAAIDLI